MLTERQLERYADVLIWALKLARKRRFRRGDIVLVRYDPAAVPLAEILQGRIMDLGLHAIMRSLGTPRMERTFFQKADPRQLAFVAPGERELFQNLHGGIYLMAPDSLTHLQDMDPKKIGKAAVVRKPLRDILRRREEEGLYGWTLCNLPTEEQARHAHLSLEEYARQIVRACYLDRSNPVKAWTEIHRKAVVIKRWLNRMEVEYYHVEGAGIDLKITPGERRQWVGVSGHNIPSFELFISPDWRGTEGVYYANQPSFRNGNIVKGVALMFQKGRVQKETAQDGEAFLRKQLDMDKGARQVGEFSLTDTRFSRINRFMANTLYDENFGGRYGNCHLALGASYTDCYRGDPAELTEETRAELGFNDSALHWDLVNTEKKRVTAHLKGGRSRLIYEDGRFTIPNL